MKYQHRVLNVLMNGILVGSLEKSAEGGLAFVYDKSWLDTPGARPISLSLPLIDKKFSGNTVYNFFDNLLPDNPQIRSRIQAKFHIQTDQPFDLLAKIGRDCVGAIQFIESDETIYSSNKMIFKPLKDKEIASILKNTQNYPLGMTNDENEFRISIAGAQEKSAFLYWKRKWNRPLGTTPTSHIFKLPIGYIQHQQMDLRDSCENEWLCSKITEAFGLPVAKCEIQYFEDVKTLIVERFDRKLSKEGNIILRLPQEDMCQALGVSPNLKYQSDGGPGIKDIMQLLLGSADPTKDRDMFFSTQILFVLLAAIDGHAKNFSIHIEAGGKYRLTPLYDIMSAYPLLASKQLQPKKIKMAMALKGKNNHYYWSDIQRRHFLSMASHTNYSIQRANELIDEMLMKVDSVVEQVASNLPNNLPTGIAQPIFDGMLLTKRKLLK
ncbi:MAG: type II toxin-antitoxin system HipA family toxin [Gammaproteobacteria bacterium]|nr:type II toxin-antitoxin system HipA family toxin [Gammaproteobacteria bacterium]